MKIFILCIAMLIISNNASANINEAILEKTKDLGYGIYQDCILIPPASPQQQAHCSDLYTTYKKLELDLVMPRVVSKSKDPSPYATNSFDICESEVGHLIFNKSGEQPYCSIK